MYLSPYSPDLSPTEWMRSKIKNHLRRIQPRCQDTFKQAIKNAFLAVQPDPILNRTLSIAIHRTNIYNFTSGYAKFF